MEEKKKKEKAKKTMREKFFLHTPLDLNLLIVIILLNIFGLIMIYSASYYYAEAVNGKAPYYFFEHQLIYVIVGFIGMIILSFFRPRFFKHKIWRWIFTIAAFALILLVRSPIGHASHGAYRWIKIGPLQLQIAEPVKICVIGALACWMTKIKYWKTAPTHIILILAAVIAAMLLFISDNMSTAFVVFLMVYCTMWINHPKPKGFWIGFFVAVAAAILAVIVIGWILPYSDAEDFRITRIRAWLHPNDDKYSVDEAYQSQRALYAVASGGFFGKGLGQSLLKFKLPEPHNDYILAIVFEELGIFGVIILTYLFIYLFYRIFLVYLRCHDKFGRILVLGVFFHLTVQTVMNYAVCLSLIPTMGVTLPFISYGGTAAACTLLELGVVFMVQRQSVEDELYREAEKELRMEDKTYDILRKNQANEAAIRDARIKKHTRDLKNRKAAQRDRR